MLKSCLISLFLLIFAAVLSAQEGSTDFIAAGDSVYDKFDNKSALQYYLQAIESDPQNYEAHWKASRAYVDVGEKLTGTERENHYKKGEEYARKAIELNLTGSDGHLHLSIALGRVALDASAKERIRMSKEIKQEVDLAIKYNPENDIAYHVLGRWNRRLADLSWVERGFANIFLGGVPKDASNENAVENFKKAIELNPNHINHHLELGITYKAMGEKMLAVKSFNRCLELPSIKEDDEEHKKSAREYLKDLK